MTCASTYDDIVERLLRQWGVWDLEGLDAEGEQARDELATAVASLDEEPQGSSPAARRVRRSWRPARGSSVAAGRTEGTRHGARAAHAGGASVGVSGL
jgi:acyl-[acyl-carrier-protein] desaturase